MGNRLSKIYTRTGDDGTTGLGDGSRTAKDGVRVEAYGTVDELNAAIGVCNATQPPADVANMLLEIQHDLFDIGAELCIPGHTVITAAKVTTLENWLDQLNAELTPLKEFILRGGTPTAASAHMACTIARRAERRVLRLATTETLNPFTIGYLNRLSDLLFVMARYCNKQANTSDVLWNRSR